MSEHDPLIRRFVETTDEAEATRELTMLIEQHALPLARAIVGRKLRAHEGDRPGRFRASDQDDVISDAMAALVEQLQDARAGTIEAPVESFANYAAVVVHSACAHYIRRRYPERARLKDRLRYVFATDPRLALWTTADGDLTCGRSEWRGTTANAAAGRALGRAFEPERRPWASLARTDLARAVTDLATSAGAPVQFDDFVAAVVSASGLVEPLHDDNASHVASVELSQEEQIDQRRLLARVWEEVKTLPLRQRLALLLNLRGATGAGLLWLLPVAGAATVRQIARLLEIPDADFAVLWADLPLDDAAIAERLGCSRQQVINLRMAARKRLGNRLRDLSAATRARGAGANLAAVSGSLKGST
jgi:RNA polymerase sigma factor (sigma-70 family)